MVAVYSHVDRMVTLGCMPTTETVPIDKGIDIWHNFGTQYFLERREIGIFNIGGAGSITADGVKVRAGLQGLPVHHAGDEGSAVRQRRRGESAKFYMVSAPAHRAYETKLIKIEDAAKKPLGAMETSNKRVINQFIHGRAADVPAIHGHDGAGAGQRMEHDAGAHLRASDGSVYVF